MKNKKSFTLLEMMVALTILMLIGSVTVVHIKKLIDVHRFESEVSDLFISLQEAQVLSAAYQTDLALDFFLDKEKLHYRFSTLEPLKERQLNQQTVALPHVASLSFKGSKVSSLHLDIYSGGRIDPRGMLTFFQSKEEHDKALCFDLRHGSLMHFLYHKSN
jgi:type II secretory pathway pseudopilin PulG